MLKLLFGIILVCSPFAKAYAHGEDKPGPHGGMIRMPGAFHTELVIDASSLKVYLLDINFEDSITENSSISGEIIQNGSSMQLACAPEEDFFRCKASPPVDFNKDGEIKILASRDGKKGVGVSYTIPIHNH